MNRLLSLFIILLMGSFSSMGEHGVANHGKLKYASDFKSFEGLNSKAQKGGVLTIGEVGTFDNLVRFIPNGVTPKSMYLTEARLTERAPDEPFSLYGFVAEDIQMDPDRKFIDFRLRKEAQWSDKKPIIPEDIIFTWKTWKEKGTPNLRLFYSKISHVEKQDSRTVRFHIKKEFHKDREVPMVMGLMPLLPKHYFEGKSFGKTTMTPPVSAGSYQVESVDPGRSITFLRIKDHWSEKVPALKGRNNFDKIKVLFFRNRHAMVEAFKAGHIDVIQETDPLSWNEALKPLSQKNKDLVATELPHHRGQGLIGFAMNTRRPIFSDDRVRQAIILALDFNWINKNLFHGAYTRSQSIFENLCVKAQGKPSPEELEIIKSLKESVSPEVYGDSYKAPLYKCEGCRRKQLRKASELLKSAGFPLVKGRRLTKEGKPFVFELILPSDAHKKSALALSRNLKKLGIEMRVRILEPSQFEQRRINYDFDMVFHDWGEEGNSPGNEQYFSWSSKAAKEPGTRNYPGINDKNVDNLIDNLVAAKDYETIVANARVLDRVIMAGHYVVPLYYLPYDMFVYKKHLGHPDENGEPLLFYRSWWSS